MNYIAIVCWMLFGSVLRLCAQTCGATYITEFQYDLKKDELVQPVKIGRIRAHRYEGNLGVCFDTRI